MPDYKINNKAGVPANAAMRATASSVATGEVFASTEFPAGDYELTWTAASAENTFVSLVTLDKTSATNTVTLPIEVV
jgi:hypothetical protein